MDGIFFAHYYLNQESLMNNKIVYFALSVLVILSSQAHIAHAVPLAETRELSESGDLIFYRDHLDQNVYWYLPNSIRAEIRSDGSESQPIIKNKYFYYAYTGLKSFNQDDEAKLKIKKGNPSIQLKFIIQDDSRSVTCNNPNQEIIQIQHPDRIGTFSEYFPATVTSRMTEGKNILDQLYKDGLGIECTGNISFKAYSEQVTDLTQQSEKILIQVKPHQYNPSRI